MRLKIFYFSLFFCLSISAVYGQYAVQDIPKELLGRATATFREDDKTILIKSPTDVTTTGKKVVTIHNNGGELHGNIFFYYNKSLQVKEVKGEILDEFGKAIRKFSLKDFDDYSAVSGYSLFDDYRVKVFQPNVTTYPYTIAYTYELKSNQNLVIEPWRPDIYKNVSVEKSAYTILSDPEEKLRIYSKNINDEPVIGTKDKLTSYQWKAENIKAIREEPYSPGRDITGMQVLVVPQTFQYFKNKGEFDDWKTFGLWMNQTLLKDKKNLPPATVSKVKELVKDLKTDKEKAKALYEFMQNKTRYISIQVGIGGFEPFPAENVDRLGYGDCKALVNYMQALLDVAEIPSYYAIVEAGDKKKDVNNDFANILDGNHIILCLPFENDTTWLECTSQEMPFGYLGDFTDDRLVLACTEDGGKVMRTTSYTYKDNLQHRIMNIKLDAKGKITGDIETTFKGTQFDNHFANYDLIRDKQLENLKRWYNINRIEFTDFNYAIQTEKNPTLTENIKFSIDNYATVSKSHLSIKPNIFNIAATIPNIRNRQEKVIINRGYTNIEEISIELPEEVVPMISPTKKEIKTDMGTYEFLTKIENKVLKCYRKIQIKEGEYSAESYESFSNLMAEAHQFDGTFYNLAIKDKL